MIKTLGDRVLIALDKGASQTAGGLHIPEAAQEKETCFGEVLAVSEHGKPTMEGVYLKTQVKVGDRVMVRKYGGTDVEVKGVENAQVFRETDIYAVIED